MIVDPKRIILLLLFIPVIHFSYSQSSQQDSTILKLPKVAGNVLDTIPAALKNVIRNSEKKILSSVKNQFNNKLVDSFRTLKNSVFNAAKNISREPIKLINAKSEYTGLADSSYLINGANYYYGNLVAQSDWSVAMIPVGVIIRDQSWSDVSVNAAANNNLPLFSIQFDRNNYLAQLKKKLSAKHDLSNLLQFDKSSLENVISNARQSLRTELSDLNKNYKGLLDNEISQLGDMQSIFTTDTRALKEKFLNADFIKSIAEKEAMLSTLQQKINNGERIKRADLNQLENEVAKMKAVQDMIHKIEEHKNKWQQSGLLKKVKDLDIFQKNSITQLLNDPSSVKKMARQYLSLNGIQRLFLNVSHLDIGKNVLSLSPMSMQHFLSSGVSTEFLTSNNRALTLVTGKQNDFNSILDYPFTNTLFSNNGRAKAVRLGVGSGTSSNTNISVSTFSQSMSGLMNAFGSERLRQVLVTTISKQLFVGSKGLIDAELSRSATQYNRTGVSTDSTLRDQGNISKIFSLNDFMANTALSLKYSDEFAEQGLRYQVSFNKLSNGYNNPGSSFLTSGSSEFGINVRKSFWKEKIIMSVRGNARTYRFGEKTDAIWRNHNLALDAKWKMKKGQYISLRYQPIKMSRIDGTVKTPVSSIERLSAETNLYKKFSHFSYRNFLTLAFQKNMYSISPGAIVNNTSLMVSSFQNILIGKNSLYVNTNYNHIDSAGLYGFLSTSFYSEAGYTYQLFKNISGSSGLTYTSTVGWFRQAGIRQTLSGQLGEKLSLNIYADLRKNLELIRPLWEEPLRIDISMRYIFKTQN